VSVVGVDACRGGWVAVRPGTAPVIKRSFAEILEAFSEASVVAVDIPIGLPETKPRPSDLAARAFVGARRSSVFLTYPPAVLAAPSYGEALMLARQLGWPGISQQSYALRRRIFEVESALEPRVIEVHPEVSFRELARRELPSKHTCGGLLQRQRLVGLPGAGHDALDAAAAAWSAKRFARGQARSLPESPEPDASGRIVAIWY
jgi:predicted RNase H-like nuclease